MTLPVCDDQFYESVFGCWFHVVVLRVALMQTAASHSSAHIPRQKAHDPLSGVRMETDGGLDGELTESKD